MSSINNNAVPQLSVVIASLSGRPYIDNCLEALNEQHGDISAEIIVADSLGSIVTDFIKDNYPRVCLITFDGPKSVAQLRAAGLKSARGSILAITEDHCIPNANWYQSLVDAHQNHSGPAIGGAVDNAANKRLVDWAAFFCEYSNYISPVPHGIVHDLPGPNVSYKRAALEPMDNTLANGYRETFLHQHLEAQGLSLWSDPSLVVWHKKHFTISAFLSERFHYGRWYAGTRNQFITSLRRLIYLLFSPLLPFLLTVRLSRRVFGRHQHRREYIMAFPLLFLFLIAWAIGEGLGYAFGSGNSEYEIS